ncbi:biotin-dependent carboxyltransferase family protein [Metabacillus herbersteinensis]|uniref:Biotin-dependent carboxyltransferase family protein n=1 Tax=Metabacillus herbersteinensis TaxID=283816 RepID=A0ABV6GGB9_9BACI
MIKIIKPGLLSTIQDKGRHGFQKDGVVVSGAMDTVSFRIANLLVGNDENAAAIEVTLLGPVVMFLQDAFISICGADFPASIDGEGIPLWATIFVRKGSKLRFGSTHTGCRAYLAVAGGFQIETIMESKSTYLRAKLGGLHGRALDVEDEISFEPPNERITKLLSIYTKKSLKLPFIKMKWSISFNSFSHSRAPKRIRVLEGEQFDFFSQVNQLALFSQPFTISTEADRMGYRLSGNKLYVNSSESMVSEAIPVGTIQVPPDGNPIILLADRQTIGGYPKIGQVACIDLPAVAQLKPGDTLSFVKIDLETAQRKLLDKERQLTELKHAISFKFEEEVSS